jgi:hypothetical protein
VHVAPRRNWWAVPTLRRIVLLAIIDAAASTAALEESFVAVHGMCAAFGP